MPTTIVNYWSDITRITETSVALSRLIIPVQSADLADRPTVKDIPTDKENCSLERL